MILEIGKLTSILIELTDALGYDIGKPEHFAAYHKAYQAIKNLIKHGESEE